MNQEPRKPGLKDTKENLLDDLEDLSGMLDEDPLAIQKELTQPYDLEDLPVLKSFVEDVPTLNESMEPSAPPPAQEEDPLAISPEVREQLSNKQKQPPTLTPDAPDTSTKVSANLQDKPSTENPFLPKSAVNNITTSTAQASKAQVSQELRSLVKQRSLPNFSPNSKEYQALRNDASKMVNEVIKLFIPRMEAELRMRLEKEVDEYLNELRKNNEE